MNKLRCQKRFLSALLSTLMLSGCSLLDAVHELVIEPITDTPEYIDEPSLKSLEFEPVSLTVTKLQTTSLEQAKRNYLRLLNNSESPDLLAESLQRLAEIESMIANNMLDQQQPEKMTTHLKMAAGYYQKLLNEHSEKIDKSRIRYQLARVLELDGNYKSSETILSDLAQLKGDQFEVIEAGFRMAENAYSNRNYNAALTLYNKVLLHENEPSKGQLNSFYNSALFKRGWTHFKKQNYDLAVDDFANLLRIIYLPTEQRNSAENSLIKETYRVTALSLSYMNGAISLSKHFTKHGHADFERELYLALANMYLQQQRFHDTATTYSTFVASNPQSIHAPEFEHKGIAVLSKSGFIDLVLKAKENFVEHYQNGADYWQKTGHLRSEKVSNWLYKNLEDVINYHHAEAQRSKKTPDYLTAAKWYRIFLNSFSKHKLATDKRWLLAETLNDAKENTASINEYKILAYQENNLSSQRKEEAGFRILLGRQKLLTEQQKQDSKNKESINQAREQLITAGILFKDTFKGVKRAPEVITQTIELQLAADKTQDAVALARTMRNTKWATKKQLKRSREVIANGEFDLQNYKLAEQAFTSLLNQDQYNKKKLNVFHQRRAQAIYKQAESFKLEKKYNLAIEHFLRLGTVEPKATVRVNAEYDAATLLLQTKAYARAVTVLQKFVTSFPKHPLAKSIPSKLIVAYEALEDWQGAAKQYEKVAATSNDLELARTATWQAAASWMKLSDKKSKETAVMLWKKYIKAYAKPVDLSLEARNHLINLYGDLKVKWKQDFWRRKIISVVDTNNLTAVRARTLAALSQLSLSTDIFNQFKTIKLRQPLKKSLKKKRNKLNTALKGFSKILDYRIQPISTQVGYRIGESYAILAKSILDSERPKAMTEIELEEYETLLEERVYPFEDKAIEALEANISQTKNDVWDHWIEQSFLQLESLMPARYKKPEVIDDYALTP